MDAMEARQMTKQALKSKIDNALYRIKEACEKGSLEVELYTNMEVSYFLDELGYKTKVFKHDNGHKIVVSW